jgi:hypothetical protein
MSLLDPKFMSWLPTIPIPFKPSTGAEKGQPSECWLVDVDTKEKFRFAFNPAISYDREHEFSYHKGILNDNATPIPTATGVKTYHFENLVYKLDRGYDIMMVTDNLRRISAMKDGKLRIMKFKSKSMIIKKCYIRGMSIRWNDDYVDNKTPRQANVSFTIVPYKPLPEPQDGGKPSTQSGFYTIKSDKTPNAKSGSSGSSGSSILSKAQKAQQAQANGPPPVDNEEDPGL